MRHADHTAEECPGYDEETMEWSCDQHCWKCRRLNDETSRPHDMRAAKPYRMHAQCIDDFEAGIVERWECENCGGGMARYFGDMLGVHTDRLGSCRGVYDLVSFPPH